MKAEGPVIAHQENNSATLRTLIGELVAIPGIIRKKKNQIYIYVKFAPPSGGATDCDDPVHGIASACNSMDLDFCEMDGCCDYIDNISC